MPGRRIQVGITNAAILDGTDKLELWDEEELIRGQRKGRNGKFQGRPPKMVPKALHDELVKRKLSKAYALLNESIVDAVLVLREVVTDDEAEYSDRIKAATLIMDRVMGRAPERIIVESEPPWAAALRNALVFPGPGEHGGIISSGEDFIDADVIDEDDRDEF